MKLRKTSREDLNQVMEIIEKAQEYFRLQGIDQWQNGYPNRDSIISDISSQVSYVLQDENDEILGTAVIMPGPDRNYHEIVQGDWHYDLPYAVIHRIAVKGDRKGQGLASFLIKEAEELTLNHSLSVIRIDTHRDNHSMQRLLAKNGFAYCGIIHLEDGAERYAYDKILR